MCGLFTYSFSYKHYRNLSTHILFEQDCELFLFMLNNLMNFEFSCLEGYCDKYFNFCFVSLFEHLSTHPCCLLRLIFS